MYDLVIIGTGPAGVSAALTAKARKLNFIWIGNKNLSQKISKAEMIVNFPGMSKVTGREMMNILKEQIKDMEIEIQEGKVDSIYNMGNYYMCCMNDQMYETKTIILATGVENIRVIEGEEEFIGKGVSYCATCDGGLYKDKKIAVVCTNPDYEEEVEYLADLAEQVDLFVSYKECQIDRENVEVSLGVPSKVYGEENVNGIVYQANEIEEQGVFFLKDSVSYAKLLQGLDTENGHIVVDQKQRTNLPGVFAAGDCTGRPYQYAKAVGEGNVAVHSVLEQLSHAI